MTSKGGAEAGFSDRLTKAVRTKEGTGVGARICTRVRPLCLDGNVAQRSEWPPGALVGPKRARHHAPGA
eukprot:3512931-Alexandrium_andersonii.AAC.1